MEDSYAAHIKALPSELRRAAYECRGELAWPATAAVRAINYFEGTRIAVLGGEVWLVRRSRPMPIVFDFGASDKEVGETWSDFVARAAESARNYVLSFSVADVCGGLKRREIPFFALTFCSEQEHAELIVRLAELKDLRSEP